MNAEFFKHVRMQLFGGSLTQSQVDGFNAVFSGWDAFGGGDRRWLAYALATTHHETGRTMQPIEEWGKGANRPYGKRIKMNRQPYTDTPAVFYGRGYVQLTWYENYDKAGRKLGVDFLHNPELVMVPETAARIMFDGMAEGWFTGLRFSSFIDGSRCDYIGARRIINGLDKAQLIAGYAQVYADALEKP
jgi:hypothetical protein